MNSEERDGWQLGVVSRFFKLATLADCMQGNPVADNKLWT
jgi:hypothetical protein